MPKDVASRNVIKVLVELLLASELISLIAVRGSKVLVRDSV